jgi:hypothetical protein
MLMTSPITPIITPSSAIKADDLSVLFSKLAQSLVKAQAPEETKAESSPMPMSMTSSLLYQIAPAPMLSHSYSELLTLTSATSLVLIDISDVISPDC